MSAGMRPTAIAAATPNGTLTRKMLRQPTAPISAPPTLGPSAGPRNSSRPAVAGMDLTASLPPNSMLMASGTSGAATRPWRMRAAISTRTSGAAAHAADASVKATTLAR